MNILLGVLVQRTCAMTDVSVLKYYKCHICRPLITQKFLLSCIISAQILTYYHLVSLQSFCKFHTIFSKAVNIVTKIFTFLKKQVFIYFSMLNTIISSNFPYLSRVLDLYFILLPSLEREYIKWLAWVTNRPYR